MFLWLMIAILVAVCSVAGFIYLTRRISAFGFIKKLSKDKKVLKYAISAGLIVLTGGIIWLIWDWINAIICLLHLVIFWLLCDLFVFIGKKISKKQASKGLIVTSNYLATNRDRRRCDRKVTPFFCVRRLILQYWVR